MTPIEKATIKSYHQHRFKQDHYSQAQKQGWVDTQVQQLRFQTIATLADFDDTSVLDVGCGYGDFKEYLDQRYKRFDYIGIDQQSEFIEGAKAKYPDQQGVWFYEADFTNCKLPLIDVVVASGLLSYVSSDERYYQKMIERLYQAAEKALIFNMLDENSFKSTGLIRGHHKETIVSFCKKLSKHVQVKDDYLPNDFTISMRK